METTLCSAKFRAQQVSGAVVVFAEGWHSTPGYDVWFEQTPQAVYPPEFILRHSSPPGLVEQVLTPFQAHVMFEAQDPVKEVVVVDAGGRREVKVDQAKDLRSSCKSRRIISSSHATIRKPLVGGGGGEIPTPFFADSSTRAERVLSVESVDTAILKLNPPVLQVRASGTVGTPGWHDAMLAPYYYVHPPTDGIWDFDFLASPPSGIVAQVTVPILARGLLKGDVLKVRGVRVHAGSNRIEQLL